MTSVAPRTLALVALTLAACGPSSFGDFRAQLNQAYCDRQVHCGFLAGSQRNQCNPPTPDALGVATPTSEDIDAAVSQGRLRFSSDAAADCIDQVRAAPCDDAALELRVALHCHHVVEPAVVPGGSCYPGECEGGTCAVTASCTGTCVADPLIGSACTPGDPNGCDPTVAYCGSTSDAGTSTICLARKQPGEPCQRDGECAYGWFCVDGSCGDAARGRAGEHCGGMTDPPCAEGLFCSMSTSTCAPQVGQGASCEQAESCKSGLACVGATLPGVCQPWSDVGQACVAAMDSRLDGCAATLACDPSTSRCVASGSPVLAALGQACKTTSDCAMPWVCANGSCQEAVALNGSCTRSPSLCAPGLSCDGQKYICTLPPGSCSAAP